MTLSFQTSWKENNFDFVIHEQANKLKDRKNVGLHKFNLTGLQKLSERWFPVFS